MTGPSANAARAKARLHQALPGGGAYGPRYQIGPNDEGLGREIPPEIKDWECPVALVTKAGVAQW